jgi:hypothetical protein
MTSCIRCAWLSCSNDLLPLLLRARSQNSSEDYCFQKGYSLDYKECKYALSALASKRLCYNGYNLHFLHPG